MNSAEKPSPTSVLYICDFVTRAVVVMVVLGVTAGLKERMTGQTSFVCYYKRFNWLELSLLTNHSLSYSAFMHNSKWWRGLQNRIEGVYWSSMFTGHRDVN